VRNVLTRSPHCARAYRYELACYGWRRCKVAVVIDQQAVIEEDRDLLLEIVGSRRVVVAFDHRQLLLARVLGEPVHDGDVTR